MPLPRAGRDDDLSGDSRMNKVDPICVSSDGGDEKNLPILRQKVGLLI